MKKDPYELLKICNSNSGKILKSKEALKLFGYSEKTAFNETAACHFALRAGHSQGSGQSSLWRLESWAILPGKTIFEIAPNPWLTYVREIKSGLFLYPRDKVPFWMLKEYGGKY